MKYIRMLSFLHQNAVISAFAHNIDSHLGHCDSLRQDHMNMVDGGHDDICNDPRTESHDQKSAVIFLSQCCGLNATKLAYMHQFKTKVCNNCEQHTAIEQACSMHNKMHAIKL